MAEIIRLRTYQSLISVSGIQFPKVYRAVLIEQPQIPVYYTLDPEHKLYQNVTIQPIRTMSPAIDDGWLFIKHHKKSRGHAFIEGYDEALFDRLIGSENVHTKYMSCETDEGFFTLQHRDPTPHTRNHLIIYTALLPQAETHHAGEIDDWKIVLSDGTVSTNPDLLYDADAKP